MLAIDRWAWTNRWHGFHPAEKGVLAGGMLLLAVTLPALTTGPLIIIVMGLITVVGAGIPAVTWLRVMALPGAFLITSIPLLMLSLDFSSGLNIELSPRGGEIALNVVLRSLAAVSCLTFLTLTTPTVDLVPLLRRLGIPQPVVDIMLLIYRLVFVFLERADNTRRAQLARQGYRDFRHSLRSLGLLVSNLFQRSLERAQRMEIGLAARGFEGELRVLTPGRVLSLSRLVIIINLLLGVAVSGLLLDMIVQ